MCSSFVSPALLASEWNGSYAADGQCFCVGAIDQTVSTRIVPTPIGGQTVSQVCERVGTGPGLLHKDGLYNYPVYSDPQCGNGPFNSQASALSGECLGSLDGQGADSSYCKPQGPQWNISIAFGPSENSGKKTAESVESSKAAASSSDVTLVASKKNKGNSKSSLSGTALSGHRNLSDKPEVTSVALTEGSDGKRQTKPLRASVVSATATEGRSIPKIEPLPPFTGRVITIDGKRYFQAREGMAASGGSPGTRIILDGLLFLHDNGNILPTDLYREPVSEEASIAEIDQAEGNDQARVQIAEFESDQSAADSKSGDSDKDEVVRTTAFATRADRNSVPKNSDTSNRIVVSNAESRNSVPRDATVADSRYVEKRGEERALINYNKRDFLPTPRAELASKESNSSLQNDVQPAIITPPSTVSQANLDANAKDGFRPNRKVPIEPPKRPVLAAASKDADAKEVEASVENTRSARSQTLDKVSVLSALKLPATVPDRKDKFSYIEAMPASFDVGGNGIVLKGSTQSHSRFHYVGRVGITSEYQELFIGGGAYLTPKTANRLTVAVQAGIEHGAFTLTDDQDSDIEVDYSDSGLYVGAASRLVLNKHVELRAGLGYSSFFEGDAMMFGGAYWRVNPQLDIVSRFELGDNDLLGLGVRFYY